MIIYNMYQICLRYHHLSHIESCEKINHICLYVVDNVKSFLELYFFHFLLIDILDLTNILLQK